MHHLQTTSWPTGFTARNEVITTSILARSHVVADERSSSDDFADVKPHHDLGADQKVDGRGFGGVQEEAAYREKEREK